MKRFYIFTCLQILLLLVIERGETNNYRLKRFIHEEEQEVENAADTTEEEFEQQQQQAETIEWGCNKNVEEVQEKFNSVFNAVSMYVYITRYMYSKTSCIKMHYFYCFTF